jgi:hypothetical protein
MAIWVEAHDQERRELWLWIMGHARLPIKEFFGELVNLPHMPNTHVYILDADMLTEEQKERLIKALAPKFNMDYESALAEFETHSIPIISDGLSVTIDDATTLFQALADDHDFGMEMVLPTMRDGLMEEE